MQKRNAYYSSRVRVIRRLSLGTTLEFYLGPCSVNAWIVNHALYLASYPAPAAGDSGGRIKARSIRSEIQVLFSPEASIMQAAAKILLLACALKLACCAHDFSNYPFKATLNHADNGSYELYWNFDYEAETISFAVRVQTTGWVGFGLSPNGQMPNSDVVIGWVTDEGQTVFHVRVFTIQQIIIVVNL